MELAQMGAMGNCVLLWLGRDRITNPILFKAPTVVTTHQVIVSDGTRTERSTLVRTTILGSNDTSRRRAPQGQTLVMNHRSRWLAGFDI